MSIQYDPDIVRLGSYWGLKIWFLYQGYLWKEVKLRFYNAIRTE